MNKICFIADYFLIASNGDLNIVNILNDEKIFLS
jgi:hypothetical protein